MLRWSFAKPKVVNNPQKILATCYRCGRKYEMRTMVEVGNDVYKCSECIKDGK